MRVRDGYRKPMEIQDWIENRLEGWHDSGALETAREGVENNRKALARLIETLHCRGVLNLADVGFIAAGYECKLEIEED